jgi:hypothetical protein
MKQPTDTDKGCDKNYLRSRRALHINPFPVEKGAVACKDSPTISKMKKNVPN